jgi:hypothetical protein
MKFIERVNSTNIILTSVPYRYDLMDFSGTNNKIKSFNRKILKLAKIYRHVSVIETVNNRLLFTKHGMHLNETGKELLTKQLVLHIFSILDVVKVKPISMGWYAKTSKLMPLKNLPNQSVLKIYSCQLRKNQSV